MQLLKEIVTAALAFTIIIYTLIVVWHSFTFSMGDATKVGDSKDLLTIMLGLAGVVSRLLLRTFPPMQGQARPTPRRMEY